MAGDELKRIIWQQVAAIPFGKVATYGQIARLCGYPGHARYVGTTLKQLPSDSALPWHRVINARGHIAFAEGSAAGQRQRERLQREGVEVEGTAVSLRRYQWDGIACNESAQN
jgi:methylated-DNA-protein-cysteine methyltransferase-like protein